MKKLFRGIQTKRPGEAQTALLKRHLIELTESFMIPLERYIASLMPLQKDISPFKVIIIFFFFVLYSEKFEQYILNIIILGYTHT